VTQTYLDLAIWPLYQKYARGRNFWAMRILIDDTVPTQVEQWLRIKSMNIQKPLFEHYSGLEPFCSHVEPTKTEHRWVDRWTLHLNVSTVVSFLKELDATFPGRCLMLFLKDGATREVPWDGACEQWLLNPSEFPLRPKQSAYIPS
jgi:hypothetical protein